MQALGTVHGLVFLFKWRQEKDDRPIATDYQDHLFFAQQMISNACAADDTVPCVGAVQASTRNHPPAKN